jgi:hypothetical protein
MTKENQFDKFCLETAEKAFASPISAKQSPSPSEVILTTYRVGHAVSCDCECFCGEFWHMMNYLNKLKELNPTMTWPEKL